jgi:4-alpha-glucanotransferase
MVSAGECRFLTGQPWKRTILHWWLRRIEKNLEWFDLLRLDHFRGFSAYWEIPADADTAIEGRWVQGPGEKLFDAIRKKFPDMPFVAEDLGMIDQDVYDLRDKYKLPGMKVLQFGFDEDPKTNGHHPENIDFHSIVYTGTHDNNTLKGWYTRELDKSIHDVLSDFFIKRITKPKMYTGR